MLHPFAFAQSHNYSIKSPFSVLSTRPAAGPLHVCHGCSGVGMTALFCICDCSGLLSGLPASTSADAISLLGQPNKQSQTAWIKTAAAHSLPVWEFRREEKQSWFPLEALMRNPFRVSFLASSSCRQPLACWLQSSSVLIFTCVLSFSVSPSLSLKDFFLGPAWWCSG